MKKSKFEAATARLALPTEFTRGLAAGDSRSDLLSDRIRDRLTDEIASGLLRPGAALDEQQVADRFGASRTPVREALRQLAATGLVEIRPRRGVSVASITPEQIMDMFETMAEVESMCVRLATYRITPLERSRLMELHQMSRALVAAGDIDGYDTFNQQFHEALYAATHNAFMADQARAIRNRLNAFGRTQLRQGDRVHQSHTEHDAVMMAIAQGDGEAAAKHMRAHMLNAATAIGRYISSTVEKQP
jgi:DNA-binding GntR family transcriptional regulator